MLGYIDLMIINVYFNYTLVQLLSKMLKKKEEFRSFRHTENVNITQS